MLEDKDLKFASQQLEGNIGTSARSGTVGGGTIVVRKKCNVQEVVVLDIQNLTKIFADSADGIREDTQRAITRLFSPSHTFSDVSYAAYSSGLANSATFTSTNTSAKEDTIIVKWKLPCIKKQMEYHKYVTMSEFYVQDEKKKSRAELDKIMAELSEMKK
jgi:hypothetical protein